MTDNEIIKALECCSKNILCGQCPLKEKNNCINKLSAYALELISRQQAEIERLHDEVSKTRRKALLEASSKFAGHSDYHGDTILCKLICMAEGKEEITKENYQEKIRALDKLAREVDYGQWGLQDVCTDK